MGEKPIIILGLGNILMGDEGFGVHFVRWFAGRHCLPPGVEIVDGGTLGYHLLDPICGAARVIVIDCLRLEDAPGTLYRFSREEITSHLPAPTTAHEVKFADVLCKAELMGECPEMTFLCLVPKRIDAMALEMTPAVRDAFPKMEGLLLEELARSGLLPEKAPRDS